MKQAYENEAFFLSMLSMILTDHTAKNLIRLKIHW